MLHELRCELRPELKLVVMSATLEPAAVADFLGAEIIQAQGRSFSVELRYDLRPISKDPLERFPQLLRSLMQERRAGCILGFLPGAPEIERTIRALGQLPGWEILPLHGGLSGAAQDRALAPLRGPRLVLSTNIAETSITLPGVRLVLDSGLAKQPHFDPRVGLSRLERREISQAEAEQRAGRAGRLGPGICRRLWTERQHSSRPQAPQPEIRRADLAGLCLQLLAWGAGPDFRFFEAPPERQMEEAGRLLERLGATQGGRLTRLGQRLSQLPLHPRLGRVLLAGQEAGCLHEAATLAALLGERDPLKGALEMVGDSDLEIRVQALEARRSPPGFDPRGLQQIRRVRDQLKGLLPGKNECSCDDERLAKLLLKGFPERVAKRRAPRSQRFRLAGGGGAVLDSKSVLKEAPLILALHLKGGRRGERAEHRIGSGLALRPEWLKLEEAEELSFDEERGVVQGWHLRHYMNLELERHRAELDPERSTRCLAQALSKDPQRILKLSPEVLRFLARLRWLIQRSPEQGFPEFLEFEPASKPGPLLLEICQGRRCFAELRHLKLLPLLKSKLSYQQLRSLNRRAPEQLKLPGGRSTTLRYSPGKPPVLSVRIQQLFGWRETPKVDGEPLLLELLAPNFRPAQITQDLASFWKNTWPEVRKQLRGRYPKHAWPEDPLAG